jgi:2-methylisocitrate lyase-like PEP mutase family enzyme
LEHRKVIRPSWRKLLQRSKLVQLPAAHDALTAKLIERAGFEAYQVGGFALDGARFAFPDIDLTRFGEKSSAVREIIAASPLPVLVDCDDGYGDVKNVTQTVHLYEQMGVSAIFIEDQQPPKRCGHMAQKRVIAANDMAIKLKAALRARESRDTVFVIARTDAIETDGIDEALRRAELYLKSGADGLFVEAPENLKQLRLIAREFQGVPLVANMLEGGGKTPWVRPDELHRMGFSMVLYPTTILFQMTRSIGRALGRLREGRPLASNDAVTMSEFEKIVELPEWSMLENRFRLGKAAAFVHNLIQRLAA